MLTAKRIENQKPAKALQKQKVEVPARLFRSFASFIHFLRTGKNLPKNVKLMPNYSVELDREKAVSAYKRIKALRTVRGARFARKGELIMAAVSEGAWVLMVTFGKLEEGRYLLSAELRYRQADS